MHTRLSRLFALAIPIVFSPLGSGAAAPAGASPPPAAPGWEKVAADFDVRMAAARERYAEKLEAIYTHYRLGGKTERAQDERHAAYYPLAAYSPEWVALREGLGVVHRGSPGAVAGGHTPKPGLAGLAGVVSGGRRRRPGRLVRRARRLPGAQP